MQVNHDKLGFLALFTVGGGPSVSGYGKTTPPGGLDMFAEGSR